MATAASKPAPHGHVGHKHHAGRGHGRAGALPAPCWPPTWTCWYFASIVPAADIAMSMLCKHLAGRQDGRAGTLQAPYPTVNIAILMLYKPHTGRLPC